MGHQTIMAAPKIYLAGPEVFLPDAVALGDRKKALCADHGFEGLYPLDDAAPSGLPPADIARAIYRANSAAIGRADCAIVNLTPFRGPSADVGTVFELGLFIGLDKPVFAYTNDDRDLLARTRAALPLSFDETTKVWSDTAGMSVEDFRQADNLMIDCCLAESGRSFHRRRVAAADRFHDLAGFVDCLREAREHFGERPGRG
jgi:nucleoside 2-deoxyribosyltransferase